MKIILETEAIPYSDCGTLLLEEAVYDKKEFDAEATETGFSYEDDLGFNTLTFKEDEKALVFARYGDSPLRFNFSSKDIYSAKEHFFVYKTPYGEIEMICILRDLRCEDKYVSWSYDLFSYDKNSSKRYLLQRIKFSYISIDGNFKR